MVNCCMTDLSACTMSTANDLSINDDSTSNACSKSYKNDILSSCCCTLPCFSKCSYIGIISCFGRKSCQLCQFLCNFFKSPEKIYRTWHFPSLINRSRYTDSHTVDFFFIQFTLCDLVKNRLCNIRQDCFSAVLLTCRDFPFLN